MRTNHFIALGLILLAVFAPVVGTAYHLTFLLQLYMMIALAQAWNLISGMTGYVSFGHAAFFGIGAYTGALLLIAGLPWWSTIAAGAGLAFLIALPLGLLTLRLRGPYFAIAMLGLNEIGRIVVTLWVDLTRGGDGISLVPSLLPSLEQNYFAMLLLAILATVFIGYVHQSRFGLELRAIRADEQAAEMVGINTTYNKILAFIISGAIPGAVGAIYAMSTSYIDPASVFSPALSVQMVVMVLLGGTGTVWGPVVGASIVMGLREVLWAEFPSLHLALLGFVLIMIVLYLPRGVLSLLDRQHSFRPDHTE